MLSFYKVVKVFISRSTHFTKSASNEAKACPQYVTIHLTHTRGAVKSYGSLVILSTFNPFKTIGTTDGI